MAQYQHMKDSQVREPSIREMWGGLRQEQTEPSSEEQADNGSAQTMKTMATLVPAETRHHTHQSQIV